MRLLDAVEMICDREVPENAKIPYLVWNLTTLNAMAAAHAAKVCTHQVLAVEFTEEESSEMLTEMVCKLIPLVQHICKEKQLDIETYLNDWDVVVQVKMHETLETYGVSVDLCAQLGMAMADLYAGGFDYRRIQKVVDQLGQLIALHGKSMADIAERINLAPMQEVTLDGTESILVH
jgi:polyhydroxyalkanoate synthesis regulator phasin